MDVTVNVKGLAELDARLQELGALAGAKLVRRVLRKVAKPLATRAKANAQSIAQSGALARSVGIVNRRPRGQQVAIVAVTSRAKDRTALYVHNAAYRRQRKGVFYGWMVDQGGATNRRPRNWWTPAVNASEGQVVSDFVRELTAAIKRMERRTGKAVNPDALVPE